MKLVFFAFLLMSSLNLLSQSKTDSLFLKTNDKFIINDFSQRDRASSKRLIMGDNNYQELINSTLVIDSTKQYGLDEINLFAKSISSIKFIKEKKDIQKYTTNKSINLVILIKRGKGQD